MNPNIPLMATQPNMLAIMGDANRLAAEQQGFQRQRQINDLYTAQGPGIMAGDPNALNALARFSPDAALNVQATRQDMSAQQEGLALRRAEAQRAAAQWAQQQDAATVAAEAQRTRTALTAAAAMYARGDREGYNRALMTYGADPAQYPFDDFPMHAATVEGALDVWEKMTPKAPDPVKVSPGETLVDPRTGKPVYTAPPNANGGFTLGPGQTRFGPDGKPLANVPVAPGSESVSTQAKLYADEQAGRVPKGTFAATYGADPVAAEKAKIELELLKRKAEALPEAEGDEKTIALLAEIGIPRNQAIRITQLYTISRDPVTGEATLIDKSTGQPVTVPGAQPGTQAATAPTGATATPSAEPQRLDFGPAYPSASSAFGVGGFFGNVANTAADTFGFGAPFQDIQTSQASFAVLQEKLINDVASAYDRQPPSWLLQNIRNLAPQAGSPFQGPDDAQAKLRALGRDLQSELQSVESQLQDRMSPAERENLRKRSIGLRNGLKRIESALNALTPGSQLRPEVEERLKAYE